jgi:hypothetical protein
MSINSISSDLYRFASSFANPDFTQSGNTSTSNATPTAQNSQTANAGSTILSQTIIQTLNQSGIDTSSGTQSHTLHTLMHDIFQAVQQGSGISQISATTGNTSSASTGYEQVSSNLQNLIQQLSTSGGTNGNSQNSVLNKLQSDYNALVQSVGGVNTTQSTAAGLQQFLSTLSLNLKAAGSSTPVTGLLIHATA